MAARSAGRGAVGVAVPVERGDGSAASASANAGGRRLRRLVGVEADVDVDLGRVVPLHQREVVAGRITTAAPRRAALAEADRLGVGVEALGGGERGRRAGATAVEALAVDATRRGRA